MSAVTGVMSSDLELMVQTVPRHPSWHLPACVYLLQREKYGKSTDLSIRWSFGFEHDADIGIDPKHHRMEYLQHCKNPIIIIKRGHAFYVVNTSHLSVFIHTVKLTQHVAYMWHIGSSLRIGKSSKWRIVKAKVTAAEMKDATTVFFFDMATLLLPEWHVSYQLAMNPKRGTPSMAPDDFYGRNYVLFRGNCDRRLFMRLRILPFARLGNVLDHRGTLQEYLADSHNRFVARVLLAYFDLFELQAAVYPCAYYDYAILHIPNFEIFTRSPEYYERQRAMKKAQRHQHLLAHFARAAIVELEEKEQEMAAEEEEEVPVGMPSRRVLQETTNSQLEEGSRMDAMGQIGIESSNQIGVKSLCAVAADGENKENAESQPDGSWPLRAKHYWQKYQRVNILVKELRVRTHNPIAPAKEKMLRMEVRLLKTAIRNLQLRQSMLRMMEKVALTRLEQKLQFGRIVEQNDLRSIMRFMLLMFAFEGDEEMKRALAQHQLMNMPAAVEPPKDAANTPSTSK